MIAPSTGSGWPFWWHACLWTFLQRSCCLSEAAKCGMSPTNDESSTTPPPHTCTRSTLPFRSLTACVMMTAAVARARCPRLQATSQSHLQAVLTPCLLAGANVGVWEQGKANCVHSFVDGRGGHYHSELSQVRKYSVECQCSCHHHGWHHHQHLVCYQHGGRDKGAVYGATRDPSHISAARGSNSATQRCFHADA